MLLQALATAIKCKERRKTNTRNHMEFFKYPIKLVRNLKSMRVWVTNG
ncbi:hypothetical protein BVRB_7g174040 [Beta vulgaris subsp. vulgaris]|nr:hypothetical protein BVRB_7g174040 [Beta vulgaris subsp. vulgaris]